MRKRWPASRFARSGCFQKKHTLPM